MPKSLDKTNGKYKQMKKLFYLLISFFFSTTVFAQKIEVQADYTDIGDVEFVAYNNTQVPLFLYINFADLSNATFDEVLPYVKMVTPGYNDLFILRRYLDAEAPSFNYEIDQFVSNPVANVDLDYPYLLPFKPQTTVQSVAIEDFKHPYKKFFADYYSTIFKALPAALVYACRNGVVVAIKKDGVLTPNAYPGGHNSVTILQPDGTLITYQNIIPKKLKEGKKIYAGEQIGNLLPQDSTLIIFITQSQLDSHELKPIIPKFQVDKESVELVVGNQILNVVHPKSVRGKEMTRREKRKHLK